MSRRTLAAASVKARCSAQAVRGRLELALLPILAGALFVLALNATPAVAAEPCPNEARRAEDPYSQALPDCRAYEQVSPVEKGLSDVGGWVESTHVAPSGEAVTFDSTAAFPGSEGDTEIYSTYVAMRGTQGWSVRNAEGISGVGIVEGRVAGVTEDLQLLIVFLKSGLYLRDSATGAYRPLALGEGSETVSEFTLVAAADGDSRIFFESSRRLLAEAPPENINHYNLYEWHEGQLSLIDLLPEAEGGKAPGGGAAAGPQGGAVDGLLTKGAVSEDGSRVFFTDAETGRLYVREPQADPAVTIAVSQGPGPAMWRAATADGSQVIYSEGAGADANLYRFTVEGEKREALTSGAAGVLGVMGIGGDGAYVYFAAEGVLAPGALAGAGNLYLFHEGQISFIADEGRGNLASKLGELLEPFESEAVWTAGHDDLPQGVPVGPAEGLRSASVSADGATLMFTSPASLTGYDNAEHVEIYVYSASNGRLTCVSCNPSGRPASAETVLYLEEPIGPADSSAISPASEPRFLSEDGSRVFFDTEEALLPQDVNGQMNVYEWEREGAGSCSAGRGEGCLYLISSGTSTEPSLFAGASGDGNDVFFFTGQPLVGQDTDELVDLYDARVGGGLAAQNPSAPVTPCQGEACRPAQTPPPALGVPVSQVFSGPGNLAAQPEAKPTVKPKQKAKKKRKTKKKKRSRADKRSKRGRG
jgi:hypothetical protein